MKNLSTLLLILLLAACAKKKEPAADPEPVITAPKTSILTGSVYPAMAAAELVLATDSNSQTKKQYRATPDSNGSYKFTNIPPGDYDLSLLASSGYIAPGPFRVKVKGEQEEAQPIIHCLSQNSTGSIYGTISPSNAAVMVMVALDGKAVMADMIEPNRGAFTFTDLPPGKYTLTFASNRGYAPPELAQVNVSPGKGATLPTVSFRSTATCSLSGTVTPVSEAQEITISGNDQKFTVKPDASGNFRVTGLIPGSFYVIATAKTGSAYYAPFGRYIDVEEAQPTDAGIFAFSNTPPVHPVIATINGTQQRSAPYAILKSNVFSVTTYLGNLRFKLDINNFQGPGEYLCTATSGNNIYLGQFGGMTNLDMFKLSQTTSKSWNANKSGGSGVIRINAYDQVNKTIIGTFSGELFGSDNTIKKITDGQLNQLPYR